MQTIHHKRNAYASACPTRLVLDRVADKWAVLILGLLGDGPVRFNQIRRQIEGISQKVLSQSLKSLERDGLVSRKAIRRCRSPSSIRLRRWAGPCPPPSMACGCGRRPTSTRC